MRKVFVFSLGLAFLCGIPLAAQAQEPDKSEGGRKNAIKLNAAALILAGIGNLYYERKISDAISLEAGYSYGESKTLNWWTSDDRISAATVEGKWYFGSKALTGASLGVYFKQQRNTDLKMKRGVNDGFDRTFTQDETWVKSGAGLAFGYQKVVASVFTLHAYYGTGYFFSQKFRGTVTNERPANYRTPDPLDSRVGVSIGVAF